MIYKLSKHKKAGTLRIPPLTEGRSGPSVCRLYLFNDHARLLVWLKCSTKFETI